VAKGGDWEDTRALRLRELLWLHSGLLWSVCRRIGAWHYKRSLLAASGRMGALEPESPLWIAHDPARDTPPGRCKRNPKKSKIVRAQGDPLTSHGFVKNLKRYAAAIGLADIHLHQTRHTFARMVGEDAGSLTEVQEALGHKDIATTRVYLERIRTERDTHSRQIARRLGLAS
jgi:hypothetical protein